MSWRQPTGWNINVAAVVLGFAAYAVGMALTHWLLGHGNYPTPFTLSVGEWSTSAWYYYDAHFVPVTGSISGVNNEMVVYESESMLAVASPYLQALRIVPVLLLGWAGAVSAARHGDRSGLGAAVVDGALVASGYLVAGLGGAYVFGVQRTVAGVTARLGPDYVLSVAYLGLVFPIVCGGVGGFFVYVSQEV